MSNLKEGEKIKLDCSVSLTGLSRTYGGRVLATLNLCNVDYCRLHFTGGESFIVDPSDYPKIHRLKKSPDAARMVRRNEQRQEEGK